MIILDCIEIYFLTGIVYVICDEICNPTDIFDTTGPDKEALLEAKKEHPIAFVLHVLAGELAALLMFLPLWPLEVFLRIMKWFRSP